MMYGLKKRQQYIPEYMFVDSKIFRYTRFIVFLVTVVEFFSVILVWHKTLISNHSFLRCESCIIDTLLIFALRNYLLHFSLEQTLFFWIRFKSIPNGCNPLVNDILSSSWLHFSEVGWNQYELYVELDSSTVSVNLVSVGDLFGEYGFHTIVTHLNYFVVFEMNLNWIFYSFVDTVRNEWVSY